jgi:hypothetical protein
VGGVSGTQLQVSVSSTPEDYSRDGCGPEPCVFLLGLADGVNLLLYKGDKARMIVFDDLEGETVVVTASSRADEFENFLPKAQRVLDTVEWKATS